MTAAQKATVGALLRDLNARGFNRYVHGGCVGADYDFHRLVVDNPYLAELRVFPSNMLHARSPLFGATSVASPQYPLDRNRLIVRYVAQNSGCMLATPKEVQEQLRSGTWSTVRYTRKCRVPLHLVLPDGTIV